MKGKPANIKQLDISDCGPACLASVAAAYRLKLPLTRVRQILGTSKAGTSAAALVRGAQLLGMTCKAVKGPVSSLPMISYPAIAHVRLASGLLHYIVLVRWSKKSVRIMDPAIGRTEHLSHAEFEKKWTGILLLIAPSEGFKQGNYKVSAVQRLWSILLPHKCALIQVVAGTIASSVLGLGTSIFVQKIVDAVIPDHNRQLLNLLGVIMVVSMGLNLLLAWFQSIASLRIAQQIDVVLILGYYRHILRLPQAFFDTMRIGEVTSRVVDALKVRQFLNNTLVSLIVNPLVVVFSLAAMFAYSAKLAFISLAIVPANAAVFILANVLNKKFQRAIMERNADFDAHLVETIGANGLIRQYCLEEKAALSAEVKLVRLLKVGWTASLGILSASTIASLISQTYTIGLLWLGGSLVLDSVLSPGQLMSCYTLSNYLTGPLVAIITTNASVQDTLIAVDRLFEVVDLEIERNDGTITFEPDKVEVIKFESVSFSYDGRTSTLSDVGFVARRGEVTVLAGSSGCGKTTILRLLERSYIPEKGQIFAGSIDIKYYSLESFRRRIGSVSQNTSLMSGSLIENIAVGEASPDMVRIVSICREVGALEFIEKLPQGFLTHLNENGTNLSGGQRQRLALVRAIHRASSILILDEPTSALDDATESNVAKLISDAAKCGALVIVSSHSPRIVAAADQVVLVSGGRVERIDRREKILDPALVAA